MARHILFTSAPNRAVRVVNPPLYSISHFATTVTNDIVPLPYQRHRASGGEIHHDDLLDS